MDNSNWIGPILGLVELEAPDLAPRIDTLPPDLVRGFETREFEKELRNGNGFEGFECARVGVLGRNVGSSGRHVADTAVAL